MVKAKSVKEILRVLTCYGFNPCDRDEPHHDGRVVVETDRGGVCVLFCSSTKEVEVTGRATDDGKEVFRAISAAYASGDLYGGEISGNGERVSGKRKIIQLTPTAGKRGFVALCDDGTIWEASNPRIHNELTWTQRNGVPQD